MRGCENIRQSESSKYHNLNQQKSEMNGISPFTRINKTSRSPDRRVITPNDQAVDPAAHDTTPSDKTIRSTDNLIVVNLPSIQSDTKTDAIIKN